MDRAELAKILTSARARLSPQEVGLPAGPRRRVAGLRREEVAQLAGLSVEYVVRLEQGRASRPSDQVLESLTAALQLEHDERDLVFRLAGSAPPLADRVEMSVRASVLRLLQRFTDLPAMVTSAKGDVLAQNAMGCALLGDLQQPSEGRPNLIWQRFLGTAAAHVAVTPDEDEATAQQLVALLRTSLSRYPEDPDLRGLIDELVSGSERFWSLWEEGRSTARRSLTKTVSHPDFGTLVLDCETLLLPDTDQSMIVYSAAAGTHEADALDELRLRCVSRDGAPGAVLAFETVPSPDRTVGE